MSGESMQPIRSENPVPQAGKTPLRLTVFRTRRGGPHPHAVSQACAAFFALMLTACSTGFSARTGRIDPPCHGRTGSRRNPSEQAARAPDGKTTRRRRRSAWGDGVGPRAAADPSMELGIALSLSKGDKPPQGRFPACEAGFWSEAVWPSNHVMNNPG